MYLSPAPPPHHAAVKLHGVAGPKVFWRKFGVHCSSPKIKEATSYIPTAPIFLPDGPWKQIPGGVTAAEGFRAAGIFGGLRAKGEKPDLALVVCDVDAMSAGSFTTNIVAAAPVVYCRNTLETSRTARAVLINAGQANAATGDAGYQDVIDCVKSLAERLQVSPEEILVESTGVIGQRIKKDALLYSLPDLVNSLSPTTEGADSAAVAITTTDLVSKSVAVEVKVGGTNVRVGGMAKGSGMIHPNMATMLGVVTTDALVTSDVWRTMVRIAVDRSFNQITFSPISSIPLPSMLCQFKHDFGAMLSMLYRDVMTGGVFVMVDGDTSTNDTVIALASGLSGSHRISSLDCDEAMQLQACLDGVMQGLAKSIAWDGEGATCLIEVNVTGANSEAEAAKIARAVASSSLVKAAVYGRDPNWGRIACAVGYAGVPFQLNKLRIILGDILLMNDGQPQSFNRDVASNYLRKAGEIHGSVGIQISVGDGPGSGKAWGCDLSYDYVKINAEYTT
ncbi:hypothetical protein NL676_002940 [Syzygium grande]|nr:hypothetical protein NL676_002940 [Syzygium grande]